MFRMVMLIWILALFTAGCASPRVSLWGDWQDPLQEQVLQGEAEEKVLVLSIRGAISTEPETGFLRKRPGALRETVSQLRKARQDSDVGALLLLIDSPGGTAVGSEALYHEIERYKADTGVPVVAQMISVAASGGYYAALSAERILAHPSTVTGSVGTIFIRPKVYGLMDKLGLDTEVSKSGKHKDMGSPFRPESDKETEMLQAMIEDMNDRFVGLVAERRGLSGEALEEVATARIYTAKQAVAAGLIDKVGFMDDALDEAISLAGLPENARVVVYRREEYPDDNIYNTAASEYSGGGPAMAVELPDWLRRPKAGFYYLWMPEYGERR
jgi:protease-4